MTYTLGVWGDWEMMRGDWRAPIPQIPADNFGMTKQTECLPGCLNRCVADLMATDSGQPLHSLLSGRRTLGDD